jgi:hypothetical protein
MGTLLDKITGDDDDETWIETLTKPPTKIISTTVHSLIMFWAGFMTYFFFMRGKPPKFIRIFMYVLVVLEIYIDIRNLIGKNLYEPFWATIGYIAIAIMWFCIAWFAKGKGYTLLVGLGIGLMLASEIYFTAKPPEKDKPDPALAYLRGLNFKRNDPAYDPIGGIAGFG